MTWIIFCYQDGHELSPETEARLHSFVAHTTRTCSWQKSPFHVISLSFCHDLWSKFSWTGPTRYVTLKSHKESFKRTQSSEWSSLRNDSLNGGLHTSCPDFPYKLLTAVLWNRIYCWCWLQVGKLEPRYSSSYLPDAFGLMQHGTVSCRNTWSHTNSEG